MNRIEPFKKLLRNVITNATRPAPSRVDTPLAYGRINTKEVDLTAEYLMHMFYDEQKCKCHWFDVELNPAWIMESFHPLSISVDRLETDYIKGSVVICSRFANLGRSTYPEKDFREVIKYLKSQWGWDGYLLYPPIQKELF